jgi:hypothetical protein
MLESVDATPDTPELRRRKLRLLARDIGLSRAQRMDLACYMLRRDITSWSRLDDEQVSRLLDGLEGFLLVGFLIDRDGRLTTAEIRAEEQLHRSRGKHPSGLADESLPESTSVS